MEVTLAYVSIAFALLVSSPALGEEQASNVLAPGYVLPKGFTSLLASGPPGSEGQRIEAVFRDPSSGMVVRYTTVRGSMADVAPSEPVHPIDVCIRDGKTGEVLMGPQIFAHRALIEGCDEAADNESEEFARTRQAALEGLEALKTVRFKSEYEPERDDLIAQTRQAAAVQELLRSLQRGTIVKEDETGTVYYFNEDAAP